MPASDARSGVLLRAVTLALLAGTLAGCSNSGRFEVNNPFDPPTPAASVKSADVTGSVSKSSTSKVAAAPLPAPAKPATTPVAAAQPATHSDVTGSVKTARPLQPAGHWSWEGGTPVTVGIDETAESIGRKYGVPASAVMQANGLSKSTDIRPGQRLVIPRYISSATLQPAPVAVAKPAPVAAAQPPKPVAPKESVHNVAAGETLIGIARKYDIGLPTLAKANNIAPNHKVTPGDRIIIPAGHHEPKQASAPSIEKPQTAPSTVASIPPQRANVATPEPAKSDTAAKTAEPAGAMPTFRWPVHGRVISSFGARANGQPNDGINVAVPEGTAVKAAEDGVVAYAGNELKGYGNLVLVRHTNGYVSAYAHASEISVKRGDNVKRGQTIAKAGQTGNVTSPQLHFEIRKGSMPVDPAQYLAGNTAAAQ
jgi:murein DD-endopeptidase MepM/ murein hydrolase activator NlpD